MGLEFLFVCIFAAGWLDLVAGLSYISLMVGWTWWQGLVLFRCWLVGLGGRAYLVIENVIICVTMW